VRRLNDGRPSDSDQPKPNGPFPGQSRRTATAQDRDQNGRTGAGHDRDRHPTGTGCRMPDSRRTLADPTDRAAGHRQRQLGAAMSGVLWPIRSKTPAETLRIILRWCRYTARSGVRWKRVPPCAGQAQTPFGRQKPCLKGWHTSVTHGDPKYDSLHSRRWDRGICPARKWTDVPECETGRWCCAGPASIALAPNFADQRSNIDDRQ